MSEQSALLREAAARLRVLAEDATPGPWHITQAWAEVNDFGEFKLAEVGTTERGTVAGAAIQTEDEGAVGNLFSANARWIAAVNPLLARPLAALMEEAARDIELNGAHPFKYGNAIYIATAIVSRPDTEGTPA